MWIHVRYINYIDCAVVIVLSIRPILAAAYKYFPRKQVISHLSCVIEKCCQ